LFGVVGKGGGAGGGGGRESAFHMWPQSDAARYPSPSFCFTLWSDSNLSLESPPARGMCVRACERGKLEEVGGEGGSVGGAVLWLMRGSLEVSWLIETEMHSS